MIILLELSNISFLIIQALNESNNADLFNFFSPSVPTKHRSW